MLSSSAKEKSWVVALLDLGRKMVLVLIACVKVLAREIIEGYSGYREQQIARWAFFFVSF
jgi:hypothetical protein